MKIIGLEEAFVRHFGELGCRWGITRTAGQICALLYLSGQLLSADEIMESLGISRSNVSVGLKELESWQLVRLQRRAGDRREYFTAPKEVWQIMRIITEERQRREIAPTLAALRELMDQQPVRLEDAMALARVRETHEVFELLNRWIQDFGREGIKQEGALLKNGAAKIV